MTFARKADAVLEKAKSLAAKKMPWGQLHNVIYGQFDGVVAKTFPSEIERQLFLDTEQYKSIQSLLTGLMKTQGIVEGLPTPEKSGRFVVRVPKTIHQNLEIEAKHEGVSLNQLSLTKLTLPLPRIASVTSNLAVAAFNTTHQGHSTDWVLIDPNLNKLFIERCRKNGLSEEGYSEYQLNHMLLNVHKNGKYSGEINPTTKPTGYKDYDDCMFAAEIAVRTLQRTDGVSLDRILCDPRMRECYDLMAAKLVRNVTAIKLRSAAINLRKTHKLRGMKMDDLIFECNLRLAGPLRSICVDEIASDPGVYVLFDEKRPLFAGETTSLHDRIATHKNGGLPEWLEPDKNECITLSYSPTPNAKREARLGWLQRYINSERPLLNYQKAA